MDQPTRDEFQDLKKRVERLEQQTEPIRITRLEIEQGDISKRLGSIQEDVSILRLDVTSVKVELRGTRTDVLKIRESQADQRDTLKEHGQRLESIEQKQDTHTELLEQLINVGESHTQHFDRIEATLGEHSKRFDRMETTQAEHTGRLDRMETTLAQLSKNQQEQNEILKMILAKLP